MCWLQDNNSSFFIAGSVALQFALQLFQGYVDCMQVTVSGWHGTLRVCHSSIYALLAFSAKVPRWDGAPFSELVPKCQPLGGLSCPVVPQLATLPTPSLKALTFTRHHRAARGGVTFAIFFFSSRREACALAPGGRQQSYKSWNGHKKCKRSCTPMQLRYFVDPTFSIMSGQNAVIYLKLLSSFLTPVQ